MIRLLMAGLLLVSVNTVADTQVTHTFKDGDVIKAEEFNRNFDDLEGAIDSIPAGATGPAGPAGATGPAGPKGDTGGTAAGDVTLASTAGDVDIDAAAGKDVDIAGGQVALRSISNEASGITLTTNGGTNETIVVTNSQGVSDVAIALTATAGGINLSTGSVLKLNPGTGGLITQRAVHRRGTSRLQPCSHHN